MAQNKEQRQKTEDRRRQVATLLLRHSTQQEIAGKLGASRQTISSDVKYLHALWRKELIDDPVVVKARELAELDDMERNCVLSYNKRRALGWATLRLRIKERKAKLLGLDAPAKQEISAPGGGPIQTDVKVILDALNDPDTRDALDALSRRLESQPSGDSG